MAKQPEILNSTTVSQVIDRGRRARVQVEQIRIVSDVPLSLIRTRSAASAQSQPPSEEPSPQTRGAVLLVHGFGQNRYSWHTSRRSFSTFLASQGFDVFNLELRGHGQSRKFGAKRAAKLSQLVRMDVPAAARAVAKLSGHKRVFLIGHSMGGLVCYGSAATKLRGMTAGIVTLGAPYNITAGSRRMNAFARIARGLRKTGLLPGETGLPLDWLGRHLHRRRRFWDRPRVPMPIRAWEPRSIEPAILDEYLGTAFDLGSNMHIAFDLLGAGESVEFRIFRRNFESLNVPLLVLAGSEDEIVPPKAVLPAYQLSQAQDRTYRVFPRGHIDLIVGRMAPKTTWIEIGNWLVARTRSPQS